MGKELGRVVFGVRRGETKTLHILANSGWLGMQGDVWDAQWDMTLALLGATLAVLAFSRLHDRTIRTVTKDRQPASDM